VSARGRYYEDGEVDRPQIRSRYAAASTCPENLGKLNVYLMYHEELESLVRHIPGIKRAASG
jgi:saccharopine dehydrogenase (NAD+, L-lysine-forming)